VISFVELPDLPRKDFVVFFEVKKKKKKFFLEANFSNLACRVFCVAALKMEIEDIEPPDVPTERLVRRSTAKLKSPYFI